MTELELPRRFWHARSARVAAAVALGLPLACFAAVRSEVDSTTVTLGEPFTLTIARDGNAAGAQPDLAPLRKDFTVLGTEASSETRIVNGSRSDLTKWIVRLQPLHAGSTQIPELSVGGEHTAPIELSVGAPSPAAQAQMSEHAFIETDAPPAGRSPYVQQQVPYTVRLFVDGDVQSGSLNPPDAGPDAVVEQIGKETRGTASRHGRDYTVIERRYAISPERSGPLKIAPATFQGTAIVPAAPGTTDTDPADDLMARMLRNSPFANDPMVRNGLMSGLGGASTTRTLTAHGPALSLDVQARPSGATLPWLPARQVTLTDSWASSPPRFTVGEPVSRVITIEARGVAASQIPTLSPPAPANARVYPESVDNQSHVDGSSIDGVSRQTVTYIPSATGTLDIPALQLAWWDTAANVQRSVALPERRFDVAPGAGGLQSQAPAPQANAQASMTAAAASAREPTPSGWTSWLAAIAQRSSVDWRRALAVVAALAVLAAALAAWRRGRRPGVRPAGPTIRAEPAITAPAAKPDKRACLGALRDACHAGDAASAAKALLQLASLEWPADPPRGLGSLAARVAVGAEEIIALDRCLYGAPPRVWDGAPLWARFKDGLRPATRRARSDPDLDDLYADARHAH